jgi:hypothetical protein
VLTGAAAMPVYETPGLHLERLDGAAPPLPAVRLDVTGFVGIAERGPLDLPVPVDSFRQFEARFGGFIGGGFLAYALKGFFDNGGQRAWIVRVASQEPPDGAATAFLPLPRRDLVDLEDHRSWRVKAASPGTWGNGLSVAVLPGRRVETRGSAEPGDGFSTPVASTSGFARDSLVRITAPGQVPPYPVRVCALVDEPGRRLWWVHPDPAQRRRRGSDLALPPLEPGRALLLESLSYTFVVRELGRVIATFADLSLVPAHPRYAPDLLAPPDYVLDAEAALLAPGDAVSRRHRLPFRTAPAPIVVMAEAEPPPIPEPLVADGLFRDLEGGRDGLSRLAVRDFIGEPFGAEPRGLQALERIGEIGLVAIPDIVVRPVPPQEFEITPQPTIDPCDPCPQPAPVAVLRPRPPAELPPLFTDAQVLQVQQALVEHCEARRNRLALLDPPVSTIADPRLGTAPIEAWRQAFDSSQAALYFPWLAVVDPLGTGVVREVPPSGHVAGQFALADRLEGVHRAPANRVLAWAEAASQAVDAPTHGLLNGHGINVIRTEPGRGLRILGARTVASDPDARFVPVRRVLMLILRAVDRGLQWAAFEPNDHATRASLVLALEGFLRGLWQRGALVGPSAAAAFSVRCDEDNNPATERAQGRLLCEIAVAPAVPFEHVVLRVGRVGDVLEVEELGTREAEAA